MRLACVGNALLDVIAFVDHDFSSRWGLHCGSSTHLGRSGLEPLLAALGDATSGAGGGAANTARTFASLGHRASFAGRVGMDPAGERYRTEMAATGVEAHLQAGSEPTGTFCALIAPDGRRTVVVDTGAALGFDADAVPDGFFAREAVLYLDGFLARTPGALERLVERGVAAGMRIALDLGGARLAARERPLFVRLLRTACAWAFMNEDEFVAVAEAGIEEALDAFSAEVPGTMVVKRAEAGAVCVSGGCVVESTVREIRALDTTGAGDAFAAGFLAAALAGAPLARCLRLGNRVAEHAIQVPGMALDPALLRKSAAALM